MSPARFGLTDSFTAMPSMATPSWPAVCVFLLQSRFEYRWRTDLLDTLESLAGAQLTQCRAAHEACRSLLHNRIAPRGVEHDTASGVAEHCRQMDSALAPQHLPHSQPPVPSPGSSRRREDEHHRVQPQVSPGGSWSRPVPGHRFSGKVSAILRPLRATVRLIETLRRALGIPILPRPHRSERLASIENACNTKWSSHCPSRF